MTYRADQAERKIQFSSFDEMASKMLHQNIKYPVDFDELNEWQQHDIHRELLNKWWDSKRSIPSIHMPRWASRILLEITDVRVERLQNISEEDAIAEGCTGKYGHLFGSDVTIEHPIEQYKELWESINGEGSWGNNPWVWAISFKRIEV